MHNDDDEPLERSLKTITDSEDYGDSIDDLLRKIGSCGPANILILIGCMIINFATASQTLLMYYAANDPSWKCVNNSSSAFCREHYGHKFSVTDDEFKKRCDLNRSEWRYDTDHTYSIVTEFDLVCGQEYLAALANAALFIGWGAGGVFTGFLCDLLGRKLILIVAFLLMSGFSLASCFITAVWQLILLRVFLGVSTGTIISVQYILLSEFCAPESRSFQINLFGLAYTVSLATLTAVAYYVRAWRHLVLFVTLPGFLGFFVSCILPESPRWLRTKGKHDKSELIIKKMAKMNKRNSSLFKLKAVVMVDHKEKTYSYLDLFKNCFLIMFVIAQAFCWLAVGLVYYSLALEAANLGGNMYANFVLVALADVPGNIIAMYVCNRFGRRKTTLISFFLAGLLLGCIAPIPKTFSLGTQIRIALAMIGKVSIDVSFCVVYIWTMELFPTVVRTQGMTICQICCRAGSATAPFIASVLSDIWPALPFIIMSGVSIFAAGISMILPETNGKASRERYEDIFTEPASINVADDVAPLLLAEDE